MNQRREIEVLAVFVHGALFALHALGIIYNIRRGNRIDVIVHGLGALYDGASTRHHWRQSR